MIVSNLILVLFFAAIIYVNIIIIRSKKLNKNKNKIKVNILQNGNVTDLPKYATPGSSGFDIETIDEEIESKVRGVFFFQMGTIWSLSYGIRQQ
jgi:hypothetical protein